MNEEIEYKVPSMEPGGKPVTKTARILRVESDEPKPGPRTVQVVHERAEEPEPRTVHVRREEAEGGVDIHEVQRRAREDS